MTTDKHNPFVLPGFGQSGEFAGNPVMASMEMMRQAWQSLAGQGGFGTQSMAATMSAEDLERRIADLRAVENWLRMNLTVLSNTIQGMEVQRATISTLKNFVANASGTAPAGQDLSAFEALLGIRPASRTSGTAAHPAGAGSSAAAAAASPASAQAAGTASTDAAGQPESPLAGVFDSDKAVAATQAWWGLLQKQFDSLAAATSATMQGAAASAADAKATTPEAPSATRKSATEAAKPARAARAPAAAGAAKAPRARPAAKSASRAGGAKTSGR